MKNVSVLKNKLIFYLIHKNRGKFVMNVCLVVLRDMTDRTVFDMMVVDWFILQITVK